jgi:hypothetical protein
VATELVKWLVTEVVMVQVVLQVVEVAVVARGHQRPHLHPQPQIPHAAVVDAVVGR